MEWGSEFLEEAVACSYGGTVPRFELVAGWIVVVGECPYVESELVDATGHG